MKLILTIIIALLQVTISIIPISGKKLADKRRPGFKRLTINGWLVSIFCFLSAIATIYLFIYSDLETQKSDEVAANLRKESTKNDSIIKALSLTNLDSIKKILITEVSVLKSANEILNFQTKSLEQITGGDNKPLIYWSIGGKSGYRFDHDRKEYNQEIEKINSLNLMAMNLGKTNIKSLIVTVEDNYSYIKKFEQKDTVMTFIPRQDFYSVTNDPIDVNASFTKYHTFEVNNLPEGKQKNIYNIPIPVGGKKYDYKIDVEWSNGSYIEYLTLFEGKFGMQIIKMKIVEKGREILDHYKFFGKKRPKEYNTQFLEGKPIRYRGDIYFVFWHTKSNLVCVSQCPKSLLTYHTWGDTKASSPIGIEKLALEMLKKEFGD